MTDRDTLIDAAVDVMVREGGRLAEWHGWRCGHPDRYGECNCNQEVAADIADAVLPLIADAIARMQQSNDIAPGDMTRRAAYREAAALVRSLGGPS